MKSPFLCFCNSYYFNKSSFQNSPWTAGITTRRRALANRFLTQEWSRRFPLRKERNMNISKNWPGSPRGSTCPSNTHKDKGHQHRKPRIQQCSRTTKVNPSFRYFRTRIVIIQITTNMAAIASKEWGRDSTGGLETICRSSFCKFLITRATIGGMIFCSQSRRTSWSIVVLMMTWLNLPGG